MNFFFGFKNKLLESKLTIPKFTNYLEIRKIPELKCSNLQKFEDLNIQEAQTNKKRQQGRSLKNKALRNDPPRKA